MMTRSILVGVSTNSLAYINAQACDVSCLGYQTFAFNYAGTAPVPIWAFLSNSQNLADIAMGIVFGKDETEIFVLGNQNSITLVSRIRATDGAVKWNYGISTIPASYYIEHKAISASE